MRRVGVSAFVPVRGMDAAQSCGMDAAGPLWPPVQRGETFKVAPFSGPAHNPRLSDAHHACSEFGNRVQRLIISRIMFGFSQKGGHARPASSFNAAVADRERRTASSTASKVLDASSLSAS